MKASKQSTQMNDNLTQPKSRQAVEPHQSAVLGFGKSLWAITAFYISVVMVQLLVISMVIPFDWVNGGRSHSYVEQLQISLMSLVILVVLTALTIYLIKQNNHRLAVIGLSLLAVWWTFGLVAQLLGTQFEKVVLAPLHVFGIVSYILAIKTKLKQGKI